ncbi:hypothetical protein TcWFU_006236 [Taenia crassiceps]|uniref:Uncharacterized protein n=1 Tax=Taenia crassiceps TaxID=6207 RepID=A0ABR4PZA5_9CEST
MHLELTSGSWTGAEFCKTEPVVDYDCLQLVLMLLLKPGDAFMMIPEEGLKSPWRLVLSVWGELCNNDAESANITVNDTSKQKALQLLVLIEIVLSPIYRGRCMRVLQNIQCSRAGGGCKEEEEEEATVNVGSWEFASDPPQQPLLRPSCTRIADSAGVKAPLVNADGAHSRN